jgi:hypothetical protein
MALMILPDESLARGGGMSAFVGRVPAVRGPQCLGAACGLPGPVPAIVPVPSVARVPVRPLRPLLPRAFRFAPFRPPLHDFGRRSTPNDIIGYGEYPVSPYTAADPAYIPPAEGPRPGCYAKDYPVPSEDDGRLRRVTVIRCYGM